MLVPWCLGVENLEGYCPGGYHPTHINDQFSDNRYTVIHKLGFGSYSTVWLARDRVADRYVALKIVAAHGSKTNHESDILAHLQAGDTSHPGRQYISSLLDVFSFHGPNRQHTCLVSEVAGCTAAGSKENSPNFKFPLATARSIAAQVSLGLSYMHSRSVGHGGEYESPFFSTDTHFQPLTDLHCRNILLQTTDMDALSVPEIYERFGEPFHVPVSRADRLPTGPEAPSYAVIPMNLIVPSNQMTSCKVKIADFGSSFLFGKEPKTLHTPTALLPPEAFFHEPVSGKADIWTLACTLYDIPSERPLFETWADDPDDVIGEMVSTLERLPTRWWEKWEKRPEFFLSDGRWNPQFERIQSPGFRSLEQRLWQMGRGETPAVCEFSADEMESLARLLRMMLVYEPRERIGADGVMESGFWRIGPGMC